MQIAKNALRQSIRILAGGLFVSVLASTLGAQEIPRPPRFDDKLYTASVVSLIAANAADTVSSLTSGGRELNPLLAGSDKKFVAVKCGVVGGTLLLEWMVVRHHPERKRFFSWINFGASAGLAGVAWHNMNIGTR